MNSSKRFSVCTALAATLLLMACATTETIVRPPVVTLTGAEVGKISFRQQTFLLHFDVSNPNSFALPVKSVRYRILFDQKQFADGETAGEFVVPARGDEQFQLSVNTDFLDSVSNLSSLLRGGLPDHVEYELQGSLTVDIPFVPAVPFSSQGVIKIDNGRH